MMRWVFLWGFAIACQAQVCGPDPEVKAAIDGIRNVPAARAVREQFPDNIWAHRAYIGRVLRDTAIKEYGEALDARPQEVMYLFLYGHALVGAKTGEAIRYLDEALERDAQLALAHARLVQVYASLNFKDAAKLRPHLEAYLKACPEADFSMYGYLEKMDAPELVRESAANLRKALAGRENANDLMFYRTLWAIEFKARGPAEYDAERALVREDLERLRKIDLATHRQLAYTFREGYKLVDDKDGLKWVDSVVPAATSSGGSAVMEAFQKFQKEHPYPPSGSPRDAYDARNEFLLKATEEWVKKWPDEEMSWSQRMSAMMMKYRGADPAFDEVADAQLRLARKSSNPEGSIFMVAGLYVNRNMHLDRVETLLKDALEGLARRPLPVESDLYPPSSARGTMLMSKVSGLGILCDFYQNRTRWDELSKTLPQLKEALDQQKASGFAQSYMENNWKSAYGRYWQKMALVADEKGRKLDALAYYGRAVDPEYRLETQSKFMTDFVLKKAKILWDSLGGTEDGWTEWARRSEAPARKTAEPATITMNATPEETKRTLPAMAIKDVGGRSWTLEDLKGKTTLINLWATWCGPCVKELPMLEKLYQRVKDRKDVVVLTLNTDDNPGLIGPFMDENHYTFPALPARDYVDSIVPSLSIPRNWIVDGNGVITLSTVGYNPTKGDGWIDETLASLEKYGRDH